MADMKKLLQFPYPNLKSPLSFPIHLQLSSHHAFAPLHRPLSISTLIPHLSSPSKDFLLISTSRQSDGSLVFQFGDASQIPPPQIDVELQNDEEIAEETLVDSVNQSDSDVQRLDTEVIELEEPILDEESVKNEMIELEESILDGESLKSEMIQLDLDESLQLVELPPLQLQAEPILDEETEMIQLDFDEALQLIELPPLQLQTEPILDEEVLEVEDIEQEESVKNEMIELDIPVIDLPPPQLQPQEPILDEEESLKSEMIQLDVDEALQLVELPPLQLQAEPILDEEVNYVGLPSIAGQEDSPSGDIIDVAFPSLEKPVVISETDVNREEISLQSEDISASPLPISSVSYPLKFNDAVPSAIVQADDDLESTDISEPAGPVPELSGTASEEACLNSVQSSTVAISVPSAMESLPEATKVNDAIAPSIQLSDGDLHSEISVVTDPGSGISAAADINLRMKNSVPSLCVVSAAASIAHSAEALAGGDAYFVCENWFGVADGVGQWSFGGIDKGLYAQELIQNCERLARTNLNTGLNSLKELLQQSAARTESSGAARILVAHIVDQVLHVANIGDSGFIVVRNGTVFKKSSPMFHEFNFPYAISSGENPVEAIEEYHVELEDGDIIVTATDGLFDNLYEREIASLVFKAVEDGKNVKDIAELLASRSQEVGRSTHARTPFADAAQAAGHAEFRGGKFDHVTVIVSTVQKECEF